MEDKSRRLAQHAFAAAVSLTLGTAANAAYVKGSWDPSFEIGGTLERLGWRGEAVFFVDTACLNGVDTSSGGVFVSDSTCDMGLVSAFTDCTTTTTPPSRRWTR